MNLSQTDIKNIIALIGRAKISGAESVGVAVLLQKLQGLLTEEKEEKK